MPWPSSSTRYRQWNVCSALTACCATMLCLLAWLCTGCDSSPADPQLARSWQSTRTEVNEALARDAPDEALASLHLFSQEINAAASRGVRASEIQRARGLVEEQILRIQQARENKQVNDIALQVATYLDRKNFDGARRFIRTSLQLSDLSDPAQDRLLGLIGDIELAQVDEIEALVRADIASGRHRIAMSRLQLAQLNTELTAPGLLRLRNLEAEISTQIATLTHPPVPVQTPPPRPSLPTPPQVPPPSGNTPFVKGLELAFVAGGEYWLGSPDDEEGRDDRWEVVPERVRLGEFYISTTEVTQEAYARVIPKAWSQYSGADIPAHSLTYAEALEFCRRLSQQDSQWTYNLPTEMEWEVAARGRQHPKAGPVVGEPADRERFLGSLETAKLTLQKYALFRENKSVSGPIAVGSKQANSMGLYDIHGNVAEWCLVDNTPAHWKSGALVERPIRGGSVLSEYERCRAGARSFEPQDAQKPTIGFRIVARSTIKLSASNGRVDP